jgi:hypothetical protein
MNLGVGRVLDTQATFTTQRTKENTGSPANFIQVHDGFRVVSVCTTGNETVPDFSDEFFHFVT